jgi:hypothetical protein
MKYKYIKLKPKQIQFENNQKNCRNITFIDKGNEKFIQTKISLQGSPAEDPSSIMGFDIGHNGFLIKTAQNQIRFIETAIKNKNEVWIEANFQRVNLDLPSDLPIPEEMRQYFHRLGLAHSTNVVKVYTENRPICNNSSSIQAVRKIGKWLNTPDRFMPK